jgi:hypothetical protein
MFHPVEVTAWRVEQRGDAYARRPSRRSHRIIRRRCERRLRRTRDRPIGSCRKSVRRCGGARHERDAAAHRGHAMPGSEGGRRRPSLTGVARLGHYGFRPLGTGAPVIRNDNRIRRISSQKDWRHVPGRPRNPPAGDVAWRIDLRDARQTPGGTRALSKPGVLDFEAPLPPTPISPGRARASR